MSFNSLNAASHDQALADRVNACAQQEAHDNPELSTTVFAEAVRDGAATIQVFLWPVAIATEDEYASALAGDNPNPGGDEAVITDGMILSAVQANWPPTWP